MPHLERHRTHRIGWLRAAVLGANDGIVSTSSLVLGVVAAGASSKSIVIAGVAGLVAGAMSMAAGEYVSVSSQADTERADLGRERRYWVRSCNPTFHGAWRVGSPVPSPTENSSPSSPLVLIRRTKT